MVSGAFAHLRHGNGINAMAWRVQGGHRKARSDLLPD